MEPTRPERRNGARVDASTSVTGIIIGLLGMLLMILGLVIAVDTVTRWIAPA